MPTLTFSIRQSTLALLLTLIALNDAKSQFANGGRLERQTQNSIQKLQQSLELGDERRASIEKGNLGRLLQRQGLRLPTGHPVVIDGDVMIAKPTTIALEKLAGQQFHNHDPLGFLSEKPVETGIFDISGIVKESLGQSRFNEGNGSLVDKLRQTAFTRKSMGRYDEAASILQDVYRGAAAVRDDKLVAESALEIASLYETWARETDGGTGVMQLRAAEKYYERLLKLPPSKTTESARNNLANLKLHQNRPREAKALLAESNWSFLPPSDRAICWYNYARATQATKEPQKAIKYYAKAISNQPSFERAIDAGFRLALGPNANVQDSLELTQVLIAKQQFDLAHPWIVRAMQRHSRHADAEMLLLSLVECWAGMGITRTEYMKTYRPRAMKAAGSKSVLLKELDAAFDLKFGHGLGGGQRPFGQWYETPERKRVLARVITMIGTQQLAPLDLSDPSPKNAFTCFTRAWKIDSTNTHALVDACVVYADAMELGALNPNDKSRFVYEIFEQKSGYYRHPYKRTHENLQNLFRLHFSLGTLYTSMKQWGNSNQVQSAIFQFSKAAELDKEMTSKFGKDHSSTPSVHRLLSVALQNSR